MGEVSRSGRTILFVSHNMGAVRLLCRSVAVLAKGHLAHYGATDAGIERYSMDVVPSHSATVDLADHSGRATGAIPLLQSVRLVDGSGRPTTRFACGDSLSVELNVVATDGSRLNIGLVFEDSFGHPLFTVGTYLSESGPLAMNNRGRVIGHVDHLPLSPGNYCLSIHAYRPHDDQPIDAVNHAMWIEVTAADYYGNGVVPQARRGRFVVRSQWLVDDPRCDYSDVTATPADLSFT
jgi:lipopolysaccharide transport system ATP-binding protein